jgi:hypothetical protein
MPRYSPQGALERLTRRPMAETATRIAASNPSAATARRPRPAAHAETARAHCRGSENTKHTTKLLLHEFVRSNEDFRDG